MNRWDMVDSNRESKGHIDDYKRETKKDTLKLSR